MGSGVEGKGLRGDGIGGVEHLKEREKKAFEACKWAAVQREAPGTWGGGVWLLDAQSSCVRTVQLIR